MAGVRTTVSAATSDDSFNDSGASLEIFANGQEISVSGFANPENNGIFTVNTSTASKITITGSNLVDEAAGQNILIRSVVLNEEIQKLEHHAIIELYELDATSIGAPSVLFFHAGTNSASSSIQWRGQIYTPFPIEITGFESSGAGRDARPKMRVANVTGVITALTSAYADLVGAKLTRVRTLAKFIDGATDADPTAEFPRDLFFIERKTLENNVIVEFELVSGIDLEGKRLPSRLVFANICPWIYRGVDCGYSGAAIAAIDDRLLTAEEIANNPELDVCGKRLTSCKIRFGSTSPLPYGGFPGTQGLPRL